MAYYHHSRHCQTLRSLFWLENCLLRSPFLILLVDGQWTAWKPWTECTRSCDSGIQTRARMCTNPSPAYGGKDCVGLSDEIKPCNKNPCPGELQLA